MQILHVGPAPRLALSVAGSGRLVLFLHGIGGRRQNWDAQLECFSSTFKAAAWDARGYGDSDDYEGALQFSVFSSDILRVLDFLACETAHLVGLSMGGRIARNFALHHPDRVRSLALANTSPGFGVMTPEQVKGFVEQRRDVDPATQARRLVDPAAHQAAHANLLAGLCALHRESYLKALEASVAQDIAAPIEGIRAPTLVIGSTRDTLYPVSVFEDLARRIPGAELEIIEGAGHLSNLEAPQRFNEVLARFLAKH